MTRDQLEHAIRAACEVSEDSEIWVKTEILCASC